MVFSQEVHVVGGERGGGIIRPSALLMNLSPERQSTQPIWRPLGEMLLFFTMVCFLTRHQSPSTDNIYVLSNSYPLDTEQNKKAYLPLCGWESSSGPGVHTPGIVRVAWMVRLYLWAVILDDGIPLMRGWGREWVGSYRGEDHVVGAVS